MPHQVESMAYFGEVPWHRLGAALEEADLYDWPAASRKAGLDWEVELVPLVTADTQAQVDHRAVRRKTDGRTLGVVGPRYAPLQNKDRDTGTRMANIMAEVMALAEVGRGNSLPSIRGTYWTAYNGVSEWLTYNRGRSEDNRLNSLWFGDSALTNRHALEVALDMAG